MSVIRNIAFYKFVNISEPYVIAKELKNLCERFRLKGTILLAQEGINGMLAGCEENVQSWEKEFRKHVVFSDIYFKQSETEKIPFRRILVKVKKEILTLRENVDPSLKTGKYLKPQELRKWFEDKKDDFVLLDARNDFEVEMGTFQGAIDPKTKSFGEFPKYIRENKEKFKDKKIVTFCTGGIRCEKATAVMLNEGFEDVYQLEGGILDYFSKTDGKAWVGECFVFDDRIAIDKNLKPRKLS